MQRHLVTAASLSLVALIALCLYWEMWGAPLRPGGSWLVIKTFPLFLPLRGILHGRRYTYQWTSLLTLGYLAEGLVRSTTDGSPSRYFAIGEVALVSLLFGLCLAYARITRKV